jgi:hypothetical protein
VPATLSPSPPASRPRAAAPPIFRRPGWWLAGGCLALGALSLLLVASVPSFDAWSWINWGRQILHLDLRTTSGAAFKPLPVVFTTVFALFGDAAQWLWIALARAGGLLALVMGFRVARRLAGGGLAGSLAGAVAAVAIALSPQYVRGLAVATSEGSLMALTLLAVERHLEGRHRQAFVVIFLVGLVRPDSWPIMAAYGLWLLARRRAGWALVLGLGGLAPALWFLPEWWGSGDPLRAGHLASEPVQNTYSVDPHPVRAAVEGAWDCVPPAIWAGVALAVLAEAVVWARRRSRPPLVLTALGAIGIAWLGGVILQVERGLVGTPRYFMGSAALLTAVGAAGWGLAIRAAATAPRTPAVLRAAAAGVVGAALAVALAAYGVHQRDELRRTADNVRWLAQSRDDLPKVIAAAGGRERIVRCGTTSSRKIQIPALAWYLHVAVPDIDWRRVHARGYVFQARTTTSTLFRPHSRRGSTTVAVSKFWRVRVAGCPVASQP